MEYPYFKGLEADRYSFYRVPKALVKADLFQKMSGDAKLLYAVLLDRMSLSIKNGWQDKHGNAYIICTIEEVMDSIHCARQKAVKLLDELEQEFQVTVITQNVDNLHERAGSSHVIHLHGELTKVTSSWQPNNPEYIRELKPEEYEVHIGDLAPDGSQLRPFIVWFGEAVPMIETAVEYAEKADIFVIIGTSLNVYPAAGLLNYVPAGVPVYLIDPKQVAIASGRKVHVIQKGASEGMAELKKMLLEKGE